MAILDGKIVSNKIRNEIKEKVNLLNKQGKTVGLAVIIIGNNPASEVYVRNKVNACHETNIESFLYQLPETTTDFEVIEIIKSLNKNEKVNGILVQLPIPKHLNKELIMQTIDVKKDVDGFSAYQVGKTFLGEKSLQSCTPKGIISLLKHYNIEMEGKHAVVVGRSNIVGKPIAMLLLQNNATVTICHSKTKNLNEITKTADILVVAVGKANFITADMVKNGVVIIDAGINRIDGKLCGDVDFDNVANKCSYITPVPGGVGPMTVTMLLKNTIEASCNVQ